MFRPSISVGSMYVCPRFLTQCEMHLLISFSNCLVLICKFTINLCVVFLSAAWLNSLFNLYAVSRGAQDGLELALQLEDLIARHFCLSLLRTGIVVKHHHP